MPSHRPVFGSNPTLEFSHWVVDELPGYLLPVRNLDRDFGPLGCETNDDLKPCSSGITDYVRIIGDDAPAKGADLFLCLQHA